MVHALTVSIFAATALPVNADAFNGQIHYDNFNQIFLKPDPQANWWINSFLGSNRVEDYCTTANEVCTSGIQQGGDKFARISLAAQSESHTPLFTEGAISELRTYEVTDAPGIWSPTPGHPIVFDTVARWSNNYNASGSGDAVGTAGIVLWNSPYEPGDTGNGLAREAFLGFTWTGKGTLSGFLEGLKTSIVYNGFPIITDAPLFPVDMNNWAHYKIVWSVNSANVQSVKFLINNQLVAEHVLPVNLTPLSVQMWSDNQDVQFGPSGLSIGYKNPIQVQNMEINSVRVEVGEDEGLL